MLVDCGNIQVKVRLPERTEGETDVKNFPL